jgi:uncharacterized lipoprotein YmbA
LLGLFLLAGCSFFSKTQNKIYSLDRIPPAAAITTTRGLPITIDSIELPPGVDRKEIVARQADHRLDVRSAELWSASLQPLVLHTLAFDLADRMAEGVVILPGASKPAGATRSIDVVFEELAAGPQSAVVLDARWILHESGRADVTHHERISIDMPALDSVNIATGMSRAVAALADRMAAQL